MMMMITTTVTTTTTTITAPAASAPGFKFPSPTGRRKAAAAPPHCYPFKCRGKTTEVATATEQEEEEVEGSTSSSFSLVIRNRNRNRDDSPHLHLHGRFNNRMFFSGFHGRRGFLFMAMLLFVLPQRQLTRGLDVKAKVIDADEPLVVQMWVRKVLSKAKAAGMLRLAFHDAGTFDMNENSGGMNGSIVFELERPENAGLSKSMKILEKAKNEVDKVQQVSWADLIAVAGAEAVSLCGGPVIPVQLGRLDARMPDPQRKLPQESLDASGLKRCFLEKGFSTQELVVLSGAHTLGSKGFGNPNVFDNSYFKILLEKPWISSASMSSMIGLPSDRALVEDDECLRWITIYAGDQVKFFDDFKSAYIKLVNTGALWRKA